ncbi:hypothetical protein BDY21DRAFT_69954 [Lineolata rhizophorae]|uniref:Uncharacterized protein n=1 Tax=Lineolata rhizophorae TaxID=578093 RepID=A0A6A6NVB2_9PEZI|nr:hypothetical protein BDY21DRAFT_69954 [Lineolata rhizophorae]
MNKDGRTLHRSGWCSTPICFSGGGVGDAFTKESLGFQLRISTAAWLLAAWQRRESSVGYARWIAWAEFVLPAGFALFLIAHCPPPISALLLSCFSTCSTGFCLPPYSFLLITNLETSALTTLSAPETFLLGLYVTDYCMENDCWWWDGRAEVCAIAPRSRSSGRTVRLQHKL